MFKILLLLLLFIAVIPEHNRKDIILRIRFIFDALMFEGRSSVCELTDIDL